MSADAHAVARRLINEQIAKANVELRTAKNSRESYRRTLEGCEIEVKICEDLIAELSASLELLEGDDV